MIPKIIHYCWISGDEYPAKIKTCVASWKKNLPDYEMRKWDASNFDMNVTAWTKEAYESHKYAFVADYIRFYALYNYGGIYLDCDVEVLKSFDDFLQYDTFWGYEYTGMPEAAVIGAAKNQAWLQKCLLWYHTHPFFDNKGKQSRVLAPYILKYGYEKTMDKKLIDLGEPVVQDNTIILPYDYFSPKNYYSGKIEITNNSYTVHHFESTWLKRSWKLKVRKSIHLFLLKIFGKINYNKLLYKIRLMLGDRAVRH